MKKSSKDIDTSYLLEANLVNRSCFFKNAPLPKKIPKLASSVIPPPVPPTVPPKSSSPSGGEK